LNRVCGNDCCSTLIDGTPHGQFVLIQLYDSVMNKNYVNYSSIARCIAECSSAYCTLFIYYGKVCCPSVNVSMNECYQNSGFYCYPSSDSSSFTCSFTYSSLTDNIATDGVCVGFSRDSKYEIKCCNVIRNSQTSSSNGLFCTNGNSMIEDSCILENKATYIFYLWTSSYPLTLSNCTDDSTTNNGSINIQNTVTKGFILALNHMSAQNCNSEYDSAGTLTAVSYVSHSTKKLYFYTCKINKARISDLISLISLFTQ
jgi:hypothetical protein